MWFDPQNQLKKLRSVVPTVLLIITICCFVLCVQELSRITRLDLHCGWIYIWIHEDLHAGTCTAVTDPGEAPGPPLFLDQTGAGRSGKYFLETTPHPLPQGLDAALPPYLKVWIQHCTMCCYHHGNSSETMLIVFTSKSGPVYNLRTTLIFSLTEAKR